MTFDEIVSETMDRLNLTSQDARDRIGKRVNSRYRDVTASLGLLVARRMVQDIELDPTDTDLDLPDVVIEDIEKVVKIAVVNDGGRVQRLTQLSYDDITNRSQPVGGTPHAFAVKRMGTSTVTITLDRYPAVTPFTLRIEGYDVTDVLADDAEPMLPLSFHQLLVEGTMADELRKMEKVPLAEIADTKFDEMVSNLRMFIAKSAYQDVVQGLNRPMSVGYRFWCDRGFV